MDIVLEAGADDLLTADAEVFEIYTAIENFESVRHALESNKIATVEGKLDMIPSTTVSVDEAKAKSVMRLLEMLDDHDDVQNVWSNFDIPAEMMA